MVVTRRALGADGCAAGWVVVSLVDGAVEDVEVVAALGEALATPVDAAGVDMPIGLIDAPRQADQAARALLPGRASSVFATPPRCVVEGFCDGSLTDHAAASRATRAATGAGLSMQ
ncbi:MAG: DUF429 domain-containing protein, partial [Actinomycetota bacterium]